VAKRKALHGEVVRAYRLVWAVDPFMLNRLELIVMYGEDFFPDSSGSAILDAALRGLVAGAPLKTVKSLGELIPNVQVAIEQLYRMRDAGEIGGRSVGDHPTHRGEHHSGGTGGRDVGQRGGA
jgi:hypothetical protein